MFVKPNPDKKVNGKALEVYDPTHRGMLPPEGRDVPKSPYWMRRVQTGDVIRVDAPAKKETKANGNAQPKAKVNTAPKAKAKAKNEKSKPAKAKAEKAPEASTENKGE